MVGEIFGRRWAILADPPPYDPVFYGFASIRLSEKNYATLPTLAIRTRDDFAWVLVTELTD